MFLKVLGAIIACSSFMLLGAQTLVAQDHALQPSSETKPPVLNPLRVGDEFVTGSILPFPSRNSKVVIRIGDKEDTGPVTDSGHFEIKPQVALQPGDTVQAKLVETVGSTDISSRWSDPKSVLNNCAMPAVPIPGQTPPTITRMEWDDGHHLKVYGKIDPSLKGRVRVCIEMEPVPGVKLTEVDENGEFVVSGLTAKEGVELAVQIVGGEDDHLQYQALSATQKIPKYLTSQYSGLRTSFIGGVDQSGFSSLTQNTGAFVQVYVEGPPHFQFSPWGRIRLLSSPQPSTNGIGSTFTDPTGQIMKADFSKVGQSVDFVIGLQKFLIGESYTHGRTALIASFGATTPLSSQDVPIIFKAPPPGTAECTELLSRFTPQKGYNPGLSPDTSDMDVHCLSSGGTKVTDIAFANQDRTNLLTKWAVGFRAIGTGACTKSYSECAAGLGLIDVTLGQDSVVTKGQVRRLVFKVEGQLPIKTGDTSYLYLFGAAYMRLKKDQEAVPLILEAEKTIPSLPSASVVILPLRQPDRDFFRLGVGLNLNQVFCKMFSSTCPSASE